MTYVLQFGLIVQFPSQGRPLEHWTGNNWNIVMGFDLQFGLIVQGNGQLGRPLEHWTGNCNCDVVMGFDLKFGLNVRGLPPPLAKGS